MEEVVADEVQESTDEKNNTAGKDEGMYQPGIKLPETKVIFICPEEFPVYQAIDKCNNYEIPGSLSQSIKSVSGLTQPPSPVVPVDSIDQDNNGNCS